MDRVGDKGRRVVGHVPGKIIGEALLQFGEPALDGFQRRDRVGARCLVNRNRSGGGAVEPRFAVEICRTELKSRHIPEPKHRAIRIGTNHDVRELFDRGKPPLGLNVQL